MKRHPWIRGAAIAVVLICSNFATSAYAQNKPENLVGPGGTNCGVNDPCTSAPRDKDKDWKPDGGELATPTAPLPSFAPRSVSAYTYNVPKDNSTLQPPVPCKDAKLIPDTNPAKGHPVVIATGEKFKLERDFVAGRSDALSMERTYRSKPRGGRLFGSNWVAGIEYPDLMIGSDSVVVTDQTGAQYVMYKLAPPPGGFPPGVMPYSGPYGTLTWYADQGGYYDLRRDGLRYIYDTNGRFRQLSTIVGGSSLLSYGYDANGTLRWITQGGGSPSSSPGRTAG